MSDSKLAAFYRDLENLTVLQFPGGLAAIPKPTRADLLQSARQWVTATREHIVDGAHDGYALTALDRLDAVLVELGVTL